ncbi:WPP domain-interacting tail-anchored protein 1-like [Dorcoceras hygrometricum]|uniref:WPP domain-interacting tail-anchored protein 1-like n=1 Tax=Dorcoceras hygrometricum TaxID=472368 RepID=A0A2Z7AM43_9LAMI|nr:WPP domain-interacting tail-anchored protein 1-like [Dorcoceras hygrometricum]
MDPCDQDMVKCRRRWLGSLEHAEPLGSLGLNGVGETADEYIPTGARQAQDEHIVQQDIVNKSVTSLEHQAHENEPHVHTEGPRGFTDNPTQLEDRSVQIVDSANNPGLDSTSEDNNADHQGSNPSHLQMVAFTADSKEETRLSFLDSSESSHTSSQRMIISSPPDSPHDNTKLDEVDKVVASIDSRMIYVESKLTSVDLRTLSIDSKMHFMESKLRSMNSIIEQLMDTQKILKLDFGRYKHIIYDKLAGQQQQLTTDLDMVKMQLAELVEHLKRVGDAKKGEGGRVDQ